MRPPGIVGHGASGGATTWPAWRMGGGGSRGWRRDRLEGGRVGAWAGAGLSEAWERVGHREVALPMAESLLHRMDGTTDRFSAGSLVPSHRCRSRAGPDPILAGTCSSSGAGMRRRDSGTLACVHQRERAAVHEMTAAAPALHGTEQRSRCWRSVARRVVVADAVCARTPWPVGALGWAATQRRGLAAVAPLGHCVLGVPCGRPWSRLPPSWPAVGGTTSRPVGGRWRRRRLRRLGWMHAPALRLGCAPLESLLRAAR